MSLVGEVISTKDNYAKIKTSRPSACGKCNKCGLINENTYNIEVDVINRLNAKVGDLVEIKEQGSITLGSAIMYIFPLMFFIIGVYISMKTIGNELISFCIGILGIIIAIIILKKIDKTGVFKKKFSPIMVSIITDDICN